MLPHYAEHSRLLQKKTETRPNTSVICTDSLMYTSLKVELIDSLQHCLGLKMECCTHENSESLFMLQKAFIDDLIEQLNF